MSRRATTARRRGPALELKVEAGACGVPAGNIAYDDFLTALATLDRLKRSAEDEAKVKDELLRRARLKAATIEARETAGDSYVVGR